MKKIRISDISPIFCLKLSIGLILLNLNLTSNAQINSNTVKDQFMLESAPWLAENITLHLDRKDYICGENIWFKAYYLLNNQLSNKNLSKVIYFELVDANGQSVSKAKFPVINSGSEGYIQIPESLLPGFYTLYAYTKWMRNLGKNYYSKSEIYIINPEKSVFTYKQDSTKINNLNVNFYPEGGKLIAGFKNTISYTVKDQNGDNMEIRGKVVDKDYRTVADFKSSANELNQFSFTPEKDAKYKALIIRKDSSQQFFQLPLITNQDVKISLEKNLDKYLKINIDLAENVLPSDKNYLIEIESNGYIYKTSEIPLSKAKSQVIFAINELISGLNRVRVHSNGQNLFDEFVAIPASDNFALEIKSDKNSYGKREKVNISIKTISLDKSNSGAQLSISVSKAKNSVIEAVEKEMQFQNLISKPDIIEDTTYLKKRIDFLPETSGLILSGKVISKSSGKPIAYSNIYLSTLNKNVIVQNAITNSEGIFYFKLDRLIGKSEIVLQMADQASADQQIIIDSEYSGDFSPSENLAIPNSDFKSGYYQKLLTNYQIQKQYAIADNSSLKEMKAQIFYGESDSTYYLQKYIDLPTLEDFFNEIVGNVQVKKKKDNYEIVINYLNSTNPLGMKPLLMVDGVPVFNISKFLKIQPSEIDRIEVINTNYILGELKYGGVISLFSKNKNLANISSSSSFSFYQFDGFSPKIKFKAKDYSSLPQLNSRIPDFRNTLYWNPSAIANEKGLADFYFYTADESGKYLITIEGCNSKGAIAKKQIVVEVK